MDKNISIVGINGNFFGNEFEQSINKVDKNRNIDLNRFGTDQITISDLFLRKQLGKDDKILLSATVDLELEFWLQRYKNENDNKKEMSISCLLEVLMWNIIYKNFNQLNDKNHEMVLSRLKKNFEQLVKKLINGSHGLNFEEIIKSCDFIEKILDYSMNEIFTGIDIQNKSEYVTEIKNEIKSVPQFFSTETEKYKETTEYKNWVKACKECHWNSNISHPSYLFITNSSSKITDENFNCIVWNNNYQNVLSSKENFVEQKDIHTEINPEENNILDLNNEQYDEYISSGGENASFHHIGFPLDKTLAMCKKSFANLLLLSYLVEEKYSSISKNSENKFYEKKRSYLKIIFKKACKNKYDNKLIQDGFTEFKKILSDKKIILNKYELNKITDSCFSNREFSMIADEDGYTNDYILGNLERFFTINNSKTEFKNDSCKIEFGKLKIREGTSYENFSMRPIDKHVSWEEINKLVQITNFIPTSELLKMNFDSAPVSINFVNSGYTTNYISKYIIKFERINDLNDESFIDGVGNCKEIVDKIFKYATIGENENSNQSFTEIKKLIEGKKIILNDNNRNVLKTLFSCVDNKFGKHKTFELIKSLYSTCSKSNEEIKFVNELIDDFCGFNQIKDGLVVNNFDENNSNLDLIEGNIEFIVKIKMECGEQDRAKHLIKYYAKTSLLDIYFGKGKDDIEAEELAADFFEFKYFDQIINSDRLYFFKRAKEICLSLQKTNKNEQLKQFKEILRSVAFGRTDYFGELLNNIDKDLFLSLGFISEMFHLDEKLEHLGAQYENGEKKEIYETKYSYHYDFDYRKKILEPVIKKFPNDADIYQKIFDGMINAHAKKRLDREEFDSLFLTTNNIDCLKSFMKTATGYNAKKELKFNYQVTIHIIDVIVKNKCTDDKELYNLFLDFISKENINFVFPNKEKLKGNPVYEKNPSEQIFWSDNYIQLAENILITYIKNMENFMNDIVFEAVKILFDKQEGIKLDFIKILLSFNYTYEENKQATRKMSKEKQNDIGRTKVIRFCLEKLKSKNQKCTKDMAKLFFNSITEDLDCVGGIVYIVKEIGFEFNENEIDEVLGDKWKNEENVIKELFGKEVADKRKKLNLENKDSIGVKKIDNNIYLQPAKENNNQNNSGNGNKPKNLKWDIYLCMILSVCIIIFSFIFSFWILLCLSLPIGYLVFRFYKLKKLKDAHDNRKIKSKVESKTVTDNVKPKEIDYTPEYMRLPDNPQY